MTVVVLKSIFIGVGGSLVLAMFFMTFLTLEKVLFIMPLFVAFNGALTGYKLIEFLKKRVANLRLFSFVIGIGGGAYTFVPVYVALNHFGAGTRSAMSFNIMDLSIYMIVSGFTCYLGARLAVRYFNL